MASLPELLRTVADGALPFGARLSAARELASVGDPRLDGRMVRAELCAIEALPVSWAQYDRFVGAGCYARREPWSDEGWAWRESAGIVGPRFHGDVAWAHLDAPNQPACVAWLEADAYARWAGKRLPTETEWASACGGGVYPWGDAWRDDAGSFRGSSGERAAPPVGIFPAGASPCGAFDLAGGVWEWCDGWFDGARTSRPARGGAWNTPPEQTRCASRNGWKPDARYSNIGFRCAAQI